jgi:hypothetical protein
MTREAHNRLSYAHEKLAAAVYVLATNPFDVKGRLHAAWEPFVLAQCPEYPPHLKAMYDEIRADLTRKPAGPFTKTAIGLTLHGMRLTTASKIAERIVSLESQVDSLLRNAEVD